MKYLLTIIYLLFTTAGITFMKMGGDSLKISLSKEFAFHIGWKTLFGMICYLISFLLWQRLLAKYDLSKIVPIATGIVQILILLVALIVFKEKISTTGLIGVILIVIGIVLMGIK